MVRRLLGTGVAAVVVLAGVTGCSSGDSTSQVKEQCKAILDGQLAVANAPSGKQRAAAIKQAQQDAAAASTPSLKSAWADVVATGSGDAASAVKIQGFAEKNCALQPLAVKFVNPNVLPPSP